MSLTVLTLLQDFVNDPATALDVDRVAQARALMRDPASLGAASEWRNLTTTANAAYNAAASDKHADEVHRLVAVTQVRVLCLAVIAASGEAPNDMELTSRAKHWSRVGLQWIMCNEVAEAERALDESARLCRSTFEVTSRRGIERRRPPNSCGSCDPRHGCTYMAAPAAPPTHVWTVLTSVAA